ncbi:ADP-ribosylation factor-like protein 3 [Saccoglossus kowalevskii]|uniref:ADP-ribosylation factor-like protein 3-like n=1 Tax=Saccoglossus kowalevskii TaxID=10224 RepID=A0ABM0GYA1_SACKO|nr:PREDICTED: ADP-ribosylation factor-like protein 3-like [Saccoglossus kowalevskii]
MAAQWFKNLGVAGKTVVVLSAGVAVAGVGCYLFHRNKDSSEDDMDGTFEVLTTEDDSPEKRVLVLGLDGSGKTSILSCLANQENKEETKPTEGFHVIVVQSEGVTLNVWEIGGRENVRSYWDNFIQDTQVLTFVVDSTDTNRFALAMDELRKVLSDERMDGVPVIVVANKQDLPGAKNASEVREFLDLQSVAKNREIHVVETQVPLNSTQLGVKTLEELLNKLTKHST